MKKGVSLIVAIPVVLAVIFAFWHAGMIKAASQSLASILAGNTENTNVKTEILQLNDKVQEQKKKINEITEKISEYQEKIDIKRREQATLQTQLAILENRIAKTELEIEQTTEEMELVTLEVQALDLQIKEKQDQIKKEKKQIAEGLRQINRADQRNKLELLLSNNSFSEFFQEIAEFEGLYSKLGISVGKLKSLQAELQLRRENADGKRLVLEKLKTKLEQSRDSLLESQHGKENLLLETQMTSQKFKQLVTQLRSEQNQIDEELLKLEGVLREKLKNSDLALSPDQVILSWPVDPGRGITAYFHDPDYPYRYIFEHPAIDIRVYQGTPVKAAAAGYVAKIKDGGRRGYSYIMIVHGGDISTVYGHLSRLSVAQDTFVERGQIIGLSGGAPGTPGAGTMTTGPHLHFETRLSGVPVDPLKFLMR